MHLLKESGLSLIEKNTITLVFLLSDCLLVLKIETTKEQNIISDYFGI